jgi:hypothetical protein
MVLARFDLECGTLSIRNGPASKGSTAVDDLGREGRAQPLLPARPHGLPAEIASIEETLAPEVLERVSGWIGLRFASR